MLRMFVSQPVLFVGGPQWLNPSAHLNEHCPPEHVGVLFVVLQALPQPPQLRTSSLVGRHRPLQQVPPVPHGVPSPLHDSAHLPPGLHFALAPASAQSPSPMQSTQR